MALAIRLLNPDSWMHPSPAPSDLFTLIFGSDRKNFRKLINDQEYSPVYKYFIQNSI